MKINFRAPTKIILVVAGMLLLGGTMLLPRSNTAYAADASISFPSANGCSAHITSGRYFDFIAADSSTNKFLVDPEINMDRLAHNYTYAVNPALHAYFSNADSDLMEKLINQNNAFVYFRATSSTILDSKCAGSMFLMQSAPYSTTFFGFYCPSLAPQPQYANKTGGCWIQRATVDPKGTISFKLPDTGKSYTLTLADSSPSTLKNSAYFGGGSNGGSGGTGPSGGGTSDCLATVTSNADLAACVKAIGGAKFVNAATIALGGDIYTTTKWSGGDGGNIHYNLISSDIPERQSGNTSGSHIPYIVLNTQGNTSDSIDFNLDNDSNSSGEISQFFGSLDRQKGNTLKLDFHNYTPQGNGGGTLVDALPVEASNFRAFAQYDPGNDTVVTVFSSGGGPESKYVGVYTAGSANTNGSQTSDNKYVLQTGGLSGCQGSRPVFTFASSPKSATANSYVTSSWYLTNSDGSCGYTSGSILVQVLKKGDAPVGTPPQSNGNGDTGSTDTCESSGFSLAWIMCSVINGLADTIDGTYEHFIQPLLETSELKDVGSNDNKVYKAWATFRTIGDIFLVIALIVIVFGESIGGGLIDAYTAKKALPRVLAAAILINLSYYIAAILVAATNVVGVGLMDLLVKPFTDGGFAIQLRNNVDGTIGSGLGIAAMVGTGWAAIAGGGALMAFLWAFVLLPALLIFIAIMMTIFLRRALIIILIIISPVAFALYCLPNTEKYFRKWWEAFTQTLLVFPIIAALFAAGKISAVVLAGTSGGPIGGAFANILAVVALIVPLALIPFAFKLAGGLLGRTHDLVNNYSKRGHQAMLGNQNNPYSWRNRTRYNLGDQYALKRERLVGQGSDSKNPFRRGVSRAANFGNLQAKRSMYNKQRSQMLQDQIATGDDTNIRDLFIAQAADGRWYRRMDLQKNTDGSLAAVPGASAIYSNAASGRIAHNKAMSLYGGDKSAVQDALYYEWKKTSFDPAKMDRIESQYSDILREHKFNDSEGGEMMTGVGFRHQGQSLSSKYSRYKKGADGNWGWQVDHVGLASEGAFNIGTYQWSNQDASTFNELGAGYDAMGATLATGQFDASGVVQEGQYKGRTREQLEVARNRIAEIAKNTNPDQRVSGTDRLRPGEQGESPQAVGYGGVSNAPVEVQNAARRLYGQIHGGQQG